MNQLKDFFLNNIVFCIVSATIGFASGFMVEHYAHQEPDMQAYTQGLQTELHRTETEIEGLFNNGSFLLNAVEGYVLSDTVDKYIDKPYTFIIYDNNDSIVYWNNNKILPFQSDIHYSRMDTVEKYEISESIFLKIRKPYDFLIDGITYYYNLEALIPLHRHYSIQNDYLEDYFSLMPKEFSEYVTISEEETEYAVADRLGRKIIYLKAKTSYPYHWFAIFSTLLYFLSSFLLLMAVHLMAQRIAISGYIIGALALLFSAFFCFRFFTIFFEFPLLTEYNIFNVRFSNVRFSDSNPAWIYSLGDFLIDITLLFWCSIFVSREIKVRHTNLYSLLQQALFLLTGYTILVGGLAGIHYVMRDIVMASTISFEFDDFSQLDLYSLLALIGIGLMFLSYFFSVYRIFVLSKTFDFSLKSKIGLFCVALSAVILSTSYVNYILIDKIVISCASVIISITLHFFVQRNSISLLWISIWLIIFSALATIMLENANIDKGIIMRKKFAKSLAFERDIETENTFNSLVPNILNDGLLKMSINNPLSPSPRRQAVDLLNYSYLDNYFFGRYDYSVHIYTENGRPYRGEKRKYVDLMNMLKSSQKTQSEYLQFYTHPDGQFSYIAKLPISQRGSLLGIIVIEFTPKKSFKKSNIYVELLSRQKKREESIYAQFNYALFKYEERVSTNGAFVAHFPYDFPRPKPGNFLLIRKTNHENHDYLIYRSEFDGTTISMIRMPQENLFRILSIFAYVFCFGIFLLLGGQLINIFLAKAFKIKFISMKFENSLREQIQRGIISVTLASFLIIAMITISHYSTEYEAYHISRLSRKIQSTARTAVWQIHESPDSLIKLPEARSLAEIHKIDVNIYDLGGNLLSSSEEVIFERHLLSRKMNPKAFQLLRNEQQNEVNQNEIINNFEYLSAYKPLKDKNDKTIAYLNLPYDIAGSKNIGSQDVAEFLGALLNVYVIFLLIAGAAAFFIANSVTNPLSVIGAKLDKVELGKKNEPIHWENDDEIGELVDQYNDMINELEDSSKKLARSQRESAWREMAKQVAHEIKNPLTPMKLNIQLLERVVNSNPEKAQKMVKRVTSTLIEQIDSLAHIASEFSNFAKMPTANNEQLNFNELVNNAYSLFKEEENMQLFLDMTDKECVVFADKTQIMRVLNNLLKNAIQAIPDDQPGIIKVKLGATSTTALLKISDNGCGIPESQKDDIFVPNFTTKSSGTGIGLAMSKTIVEMAKGQISFESVEGKGTDFFVELPLHIPEKEVEKKEVV